MAGTGVGKENSHSHTHIIDVYIIYTHTRTFTKMLSHCVMHEAARLSLVVCSRCGGGAGGLALFLLGATAAGMRVYSDVMCVEGR